MIAASHVVAEDPLKELSLPRDAATRLCFFAIPLAMHPYYRERVYPIVLEAGLVPVTADDVISRGDNFLPKIDALLERALVVVVDASSPFTISEIRMVLSSRDPNRLIVITEDPDRLPVDLHQTRILRRPDIMTVDQEPFLDELRLIFNSAAAQQAPTLEDEPMRLFNAGEYRPAVISAITLLESVLVDRLDVSRSSHQRAMSLGQLLNMAGVGGLIPHYDVEQIMRWLRIRNEAVHRLTSVPRSTAQEIITGVLDIFNELKRQA